MNKYDFYKELMSTYTVDTEKIKYNAKRRKLRRRNTAVIRIAAGCTAAAAAVAVTVASFNLFGNHDPGMDLTYTGTLSPEAAAQRVQAAESGINAVAHIKDERMDMYVSFESAMSKNEIMLLFSAVDQYGDINLRLLYSQDGTKTAPYAAPLNDRIYTGAKISSPVSLCRDIRFHRAVILLELAEGGTTDDSFIPFENSMTVTSQNDPVTDNIYTFPSGTFSSQSSSQETTTSETENTTPSVTTEVSASTPEENGNILIPVSGVKTVNVISGDRIVVTTDDSIRLFRLENGALINETTFYASNAKIIAYNSRLYITACDGNRRNRLYCADGIAGTLTELDISGITADGAEIAFVGVGAENDLIIRTVTLEKTRIYLVKRGADALAITLTGEYTTPVSPIAYINGVIYNAVTDSEGETARIFSVNTADGSTADLTVLDGAVRWTVSPSFNSAMLTITAGSGEESYLFLTPEGQLVESPVGNVTFAPLDGGVFTDGTAYYALKDGAVAVISEEEALPFFDIPALSNMEYEIDENGTAYLFTAE